MENLNEQLKQNVMNRVARIHAWKAWKASARPFVIECATLFCLIFISALLISLHNIFTNMSATNHSLDSLYRFVISAFVKTELSVKTLSLAILVLCGLIARDVLLGVSRVGGNLLHRLS